MEEASLPEEIIVHILTYLPVKSLIRFTCVTKHFHSLILSDPKFARSQFQTPTPTRRLLYSADGPRFESLDLDTPSFGDPRELKPPFRLPDSSADVPLLGSCNGIVFLALDETHESTFYMWNPSIGFFKMLPHPGLSPKESKPFAFGVGYLPATKDYRVCAVFNDFSAVEKKVLMFSSRAHAWKTLEFDSDEIWFVFGRGILLKEALHWVGDRGHDEILAFDLGQEEEEEEQKHKFRTMLLPGGLSDDGESDYIEKHLGVSADGGCLSLVSLPQGSTRVDVWVMGEYGVRDSWTKLFKLKLLDPAMDFDWTFNDVLVLETGFVAQIIVHHMIRSELGLVKIVQNEEDKFRIYTVKGNLVSMIHYQESLIRIDD